MSQTIFCNMTEALHVSCTPVMLTYHAIGVSALLSSAAIHHVTARIIKLAGCCSASSVHCIGNAHAACIGPNHCVVLCRLGKMQKDITEADDHCKRLQKVLPHTPTHTLRYILT